MKQVKPYNCFSVLFLPFKDSGMKLNVCGIFAHVRFCQLQNFPRILNSKVHRIVHFWLMWLHGKREKVLLLFFLSKYMFLFSCLKLIVFFKCQNRMNCVKSSRARLVGQCEFKGLFSSYGCDSGGRCVTGKPTGHVWQADSDKLEVSGFCILLKDILKIH